MGWGGMGGCWRRWGRTRGAGGDAESRQPRVGQGGAGGDRTGGAVSPGQDGVGTAGSVAQDSGEQVGRSTGNTAELGIRPPPGKPAARRQGDTRGRQGWAGQRRVPRGMGAGSCRPWPGCRVAAGRGQGAWKRAGRGQGAASPGRLQAAGCPRQGAGRVLPAPGRVQGGGGHG